MKLQKTETERQIAGMGKISLTSPAMMIGTEHNMVSKIVSAILMGSVIAASNLDIISLFR
jgi:hypothetical protein